MATSPKKTTKTRFKLPKQTKLCSLRAIDALFASGKGALAYPLRILYAPPAGAAEGVRFFVSIPKKRVRRAVERVQMRRRVREAYRRLRPGLPAELNLDIAFLYVANGPEPYRKVEAAMNKLLNQICAACSANC